MLRLRVWVSCIGAGVRRDGGRARSASAPISDSTRRLQSFASSEASPGSCNTVKKPRASSAVERRLSVRSRLSEVRCSGDPVAGESACVSARTIPTDVSSRQPPRSSVSHADVRDSSRVSRQWPSASPEMSTRFATETRARQAALQSRETHGSSAPSRSATKLSVCCSASCASDASVAGSGGGASIYCVYSLPTQPNSPVCDVWLIY